MLFPDTSFKAYRDYLDYCRGEFMTYQDWVKWIWEEHAQEEKAG